MYVLEFQFQLFRTFGLEALGRGISRTLSSQCLFFLVFSYLVFRSMHNLHLSLPLITKSVTFGYLSASRHPTIPLKYYCRSTPPKPLFLYLSIDQKLALLVQNIQGLKILQHLRENSKISSITGNNCRFLSYLFLKAVLALANSDVLYFEC